MSPMKLWLSMPSLSRQKDQSSTDNIPPRYIIELLQLTIMPSPSAILRLAFLTCLPVSHAPCLAVLIVLSACGSLV